MVLVIDKSGSMEGQKIEMAREAIRGAVELLGPGDRIGVIAFDETAAWVSELQTCTDKGSILGRVDGIRAQGGTSILPAIQAATDALTALGPAAKFKHMILLSDGIDMSSAADLTDAAGRAAESKITVTTVGIWADADKPTMEAIALRGGARYHFTDNPATLPPIFAKETAQAGQDAIQEQLFTAVPYRPTAVLADLDWAEARRSRVYPDADQADERGGPPRPAGSTRCSRGGGPAWGCVPRSPGT